MAIISIEFLLHRGGSWDGARPSYIHGFLLLRVQQAQHPTTICEPLRQVQQRFGNENWFVPSERSSSSLQASMTSI